MLSRAFQVYLSGIVLGLRTIKAGLLVEGLRLLLTPIGYWRFVPNGYVLRDFLALGNPTVLDVGSPKLLSMVLASKSSHSVYATDLNDDKIFTRWKCIAEALQLKNYIVEYQDARTLAYADNSFDLVYSINVLQHIPEDGDSVALAEFRRVLKPNGILVIEVAYRRRREEVFAKYDSKGRPVDKLQFYERHYDAEFLRQRLEIQGLRMEEKLILGEWLPIDSWIASDRLPRFLRILIHPAEPLLAAVNYWARRDDTLGRPLAALMAYRKI